MLEHAFQRPDGLYKWAGKCALGVLPALYAANASGRAYNCLLQDAGSMRRTFGVRKT